jgi:hypothetical protein
LCRRTDDDFSDIDIVRLLDREQNGAGNRIWRHRELVPRLDEPRARTSALPTASAKFVRVNPGEMTVTRSFSEPTSCLRPSEIARTANLVPE